MNTQPIDQILQRAVSEGNVPGVVVIAANQDGVVYKGAFGKRSIDSDTSMTLDTVFWIASMSKAITSTAAMQLVEQGKLQLDEPLIRVLPELDSIQVLEGFDNSGQPKLRPPKRPITLRHLLTHTAGFSYDMWNEDIVHYMKYKKIPGIIECKNTSLKIPIVFDPGDRWEYGINIDWAGKAIEAVSGQSLRDYLKNNVFTPLGMDDTDFIIQSDSRLRMASMHQRDPNGELHRIDFEVPQEPEFFMGGGGLYSTAEDYVKFLQMLLHGGIFKGVRILQTETVKEMGTNQIGNLHVLPMRSAISSLTNDVEFFPSMVKKWGFGHMITTEEATTGRSAGSLAWAGLGNTYYWIDPVKSVCGVLLTQVFPFADYFVLELLTEFETAFYKQL
jgi:CubicO group peptidase (beta-lactamase class C family)